MMVQNLSPAMTTVERGGAAIGAHGMGTGFDPSLGGLCEGRGWFSYG